VKYNISFINQQHENKIIFQIAWNIKSQKQTKGGRGVGSEREREGSVTGFTTMMGWGID